MIGLIIVFGGSMWIFYPQVKRIADALEKLAKHKEDGK